MLQKSPEKSRLIKRRNRPPLLLWSAVLLAGWSAILSAHAQRCGRDAPQGPVRVQLFDVFSGQPLPNADVEVTSDNGIRCVQPPCPTITKKWSGRSDDAGVVAIPRTAIQANWLIFLSAKDHRATDLPKDAVKAASGTIRLELYPEWLDSELNWNRGYKLLDARSGKLLVNTPVRIEFPANDWPARHGGISGLAAKTNRLVYVFFSFLRKPKEGQGQTSPDTPEADWGSLVARVIVSGYRKARLEFDGPGAEGTVVRLRRQ